MATAGILFLYALGAFLTASGIPMLMIDAGMWESAAQLDHWLLRGIHIFGFIAGVMTFAIELHDPLTEQEAKELEEKENSEK